MKQVVIDDKTSGYKLFRFIKNILPQFKNNDIFKLIRKKRIKINNRKTNQDYILKEGDKVTLFLDEKYFDQNKKNKFHSVKSNFSIVYEDKNVLVINKPVGLLIHPNRNEYKNTLSEMIKKYLYLKNEYSIEDTFSPASCNRLDRNTSGLVIFAKNHKTLQFITKQFRERRVTKEYFAIVYGEINKKALLFSKLDTSTTIVGSSKISILYNIPEKSTFLKEHPNESVTALYPVKCNSDYSVVKVYLWTGKKHQIRVHLAKYNHPLIGDYKYFTYNSRQLSNASGIKHYYLHCSRIELSRYGKWTSSPPWNIDNFLL